MKACFAIESSLPPKRQTGQLTHGQVQTTHPKLECLYCDRLNIKGDLGSLLKGIVVLSLGGILLRMISEQ